MPGLARGQIRLAARTMIGMAILLQCAAVTRGTRLLFQHELGSDFMAFYTAGRTLNRLAPAVRMYDAELQQRLRSEIMPEADKATRLPYLYPPFIAAAMSPLARLPYRWAFASWLAIGGALYAAGLFLLQSCCPLGPHRHTAVLLALSFPPFLFEAWGGGQISALAFSALAAALWMERSGRPLAAGLCAGICCYKPTVLLVLAFMFLAARLWRLLAGALLSSSALAGLSFLMLGRDGATTYLRFMMQYGSAVSARPSAWRLHKFVDPNAFFHLLFGGDTRIGRALFYLAAAAALWVAARAWARYRRASREQRALCWAGTMPVLLLASFYAPVYDASLLVLSGFLVAGVVYRKGQPELIRAFEATVLLVYVGATVSQPIARVLHFQVFTIILALSAWYAFSLSGASRERSPTSQKRTAGAQPLPVLQRICY
jgi:hypothetical protein